MKTGQRGLKNLQEHNRQSNVCDWNPSTRGIGIQTSYIYSVKPYKSMFLFEKKMAKILSKFDRNCNVTDIRSSTNSNPISYMHTYTQSPHYNTAYTSG